MAYSVKQDVVLAGRLGGVQNSTQKPSCLNGELERRDRTKVATLATLGRLRQPSLCTRVCGKQVTLQFSMVAGRNRYFM